MRPQKEAFDIQLRESEENSLTLSEVWTSFGVFLCVELYTDSIYEH